VRSPKLVPLVLSDAERASLEALSRKRTASQALAERSRVVLACDLAGGPVIAQHYRRHRHQEFLRFLKLIDSAVPKDLRFHLRFTPTSSSWLNLAERWFAELTNRRLRRSAHRAVTELETGIRKWTSEWNKAPKPFVRTKSAGEILETPAIYCPRIIGSGH
jgi:transposase